MNQEDIIRMAREVGLWPAVTDNFSKELVALAAKELVAFAKLVAAAEREKVAKQWEQLHGFDKHAVAAFIRARGDTK
jgi:hypothetical protein